MLEDVNQLAQESEVHGSGVTEHVVNHFCTQVDSKYHLLYLQLPWPWLLG